MTAPRLAHWFLQRPTVCMMTSECLFPSLGSRTPLTPSTRARFVYANNRYKMAGQWFGLPKLFPESRNLGYEVIKNESTLIQFKNEQEWTFPIIPKKATINALVSLELDPATADSDFPLILWVPVCYRAVATADRASANAQVPQGPGQ